MSDVLKCRRGIVIQFTMGEFSDFRTSALVVITADCNLPELARQFLQSEKARIDTDLKTNPYTYQRPECENFPAWLIANGHAAPVESSEVHLGDYAEFDREFGVTR